MFTYEHHILHASTALHVTAAGEGSLCAIGPNVCLIFKAHVVGNNVDIFIADET